MNRKAPLAVFESLRNDGPDFINDIIGHGVATNRRAATMYHEIIAGTLVRAIKQIGIAKIKRAMPARVGIKLVFGDGIKTFGGMPVALFLLGTKASRIIADRIGGKALEVFLVLDPDFQPGFFF